MRSHVGRARIWRARVGRTGIFAEARDGETTADAAQLLVIAEVEEIAEAGGLDPASIVTPAVYVDRIVRCEPLEVRWDGS